MSSSNSSNGKGENIIVTKDVHYLNMEGKRVEESEATKILTFYLDANGYVVKMAMEMLPSNRWLNG